jgi:hypothetical protein
MMKQNKLVKSNLRNFIGTMLTAGLVASLSCNICYAVVNCDVLEGSWTGECVDGDGKKSKESVIIIQDLPDATCTIRLNGQMFNSFNSEWSEGTQVTQMSYSLGVVLAINHGSWREDGKTFVTYPRISSRFSGCQDLIYDRSGSTSYFRDGEGLKSITNLSQKWTRLRSGEVTGERSMQKTCSYIKGEVSFKDINKNEEIVQPACDTKKL